MINGRRTPTLAATINARCSRCPRKLSAAIETMRSRRIELTSLGEAREKAAAVQAVFDFTAEFLEGIGFQPRCLICDRRRHIGGAFANAVHNALALRQRNACVTRRTRGLATGSPDSRGSRISRSLSFRGVCFLIIRGHTAKSSSSNQVRKADRCNSHKQIGASDVQTVARDDGFR